MSKDKSIDIKKLQQDSRNFNKGTEEGHRLMKQSFERFGAGRSILVDKDNNIIAGNKSQQAAIEAGITKVRIIETDGTELIAVKRTDIDINSAEGRELALADNATAAANLDWDKAELASISDDLNIDMNDWKVKLPNPVESEETEKAPKEEKELKLTFTPEQYSFVLQELRKYGNDFTHSLLTILNINE